MVLFTTPGGTGNPLKIQSGCVNVIRIWQSNRFKEGWNQTMMVPGPKDYMKKTKFDDLFNQENTENKRTKTALMKECMSVMKPRVCQPTCNSKTSNTISHCVSAKGSYAWPLPPCRRPQEHMKPLVFAAAGTVETPVC